jgi:hypothetical protein
MFYCNYYNVYSQMLKIFLMPSRCMLCCLFFLYTRFLKQSRAPRGNASNEENRHRRLKGGVYAGE